MAKFRVSAADRRKLERAVVKQASKALRPVAAELQGVLNGMSAEFEGRPVEEIKPVLVARYAKATSGGTITDPHLTAYAEQISGGGKFRFEA